MKIIGEKFVHFEHIIYQPTISCLGKCKNCYIQKDFKDQAAVLTLSENIHCNQFTIAIDKKPTAKDADVVEDLSQSVLDDTELCITVRNTLSLSLLE